MTGREQVLAWAGAVHGVGDCIPGQVTKTSASHCKAYPLEAGSWWGFNEGGVQLGEHTGSDGRGEAVVPEATGRESAHTDTMTEKAGSSGGTRGRRDRSSHVFSYPNPQTSQ